MARLNFQQPLLRYSKTFIIIISVENSWTASYFCWNYSKVWDKIFFFKEIFIFILQGHIELIKSDSIDFF